MLCCNFSSVDGLFPKIRTNFQLAKKNPKFLEILTKLQMSKLDETFSISEVFKYSMFGQDALHYIHQENF